MSLWGWKTLPNVYLYIHVRDIYIYIYIYIYICTNVYSYIYYLHKYIYRYRGCCKNCAFGNLGSTSPDLLNDILQPTSVFRGAFEVPVHRVWILLLRICGDLRYCYTEFVRNHLFPYRDSLEGTRGTLRNPGEPWGTLGSPEGPWGNHFLSNGQSARAARNTSLPFPLLGNLEELSRDTGVGATCWPFSKKEVRTCKDPFRQA